MADIKWIKITTGMFEDEKLRLIDALPERDTIHYVWMRLLAQAGKTNDNGRIFLNENMYYSKKVLSILFNRPIASIKIALNVLCKYSMINIDDDNTISIINWDKHQNVKGMERIKEQTKKRVASHRNRQKGDNLELQEEDDNSLVERNVTEKRCNATVTQQNKNKNKNKKEEIDKEIEKKIQKELDIEPEKESAELSGIEIKEKADEIEGDSLSVLLHYEKLTGILGVFSLGALKQSITHHGEQNVRKAIDKSLEVNKVNMTYVNGILRNWRRDGYPREAQRYGIGKSMLSNGNKFKGFKPKKSRELTDKEREESERRLI